MHITHCPSPSPSALCLRAYRLAKDMSSLSLYPAHYLSCARSISPVRLRSAPDEIHVNACVTFVSLRWMGAVFFALAGNCKDNTQPYNSQHWCPNTNLQIKIAQWRSEVSQYKHDPFLVQSADGKMNRATKLCLYAFSSSSIDS